MLSLSCTAIQQQCLVLNKDFSHVWFFHIQIPYHHVSFRFHANHCTVVMQHSDGLVQAYFPCKLSKHLEFSNRSDVFEFPQSASQLQVHCLNLAMRIHACAWFAIQNACQNGCMHEFSSLNCDNEPENPCKCWRVVWKLQWVCYWAWALD